MTDVASLALEVRSDQVSQATAALKAMPAAASAAERAAEKWGVSTRDAARSTEDFSRRVQRTIRDLAFEREQLARSANEQARYAALKRAGVTASSAEGQAITASVRALQAQQAALGQTTLAAKGLNAAWSQIRTLLGAFALAAIVDKLIEFGKAAFEAAAGMDELAEQMGVSARLFQALTYAAVQNGIKIEQLETGLSKFSQKMGEAADGDKEMIDSLNRLGVKNLDFQGKLRPTEDLLVDVAKAISSLEDPAKRSSAAVDFFGKAGTKMLPILAQIAGGTDAMAVSAENAGAVISDFAIKKLDKVSDAMERGALVSRAWAAELIANTVDIGEKIAALAEGVATGLERLFRSLVTSVDQWLTPVGDKIGQVGASAAAMFVEAFAALPETLGQLFTNAWEAARVASAKGINAIIDAMPEWMRPGGRLDTTPQGTGPVGAGLGDRIAAAGAQAAADMAARQQAAQAERAAQALLDRQAGMEGDEARARRGKLGAAGTTGARTSAVRDAGKEAENAAKKYAQLITQLDQAVAAQDAMVAASGRGETAFESLKVHLEAQEKALQIFGKALDDTDPKLKAIEERLLRIAQGKAAEAFNVATTELEKQNVLLEAQIRLMGEAPEIQAKEIALIKAKQEAEKAGTAVTQEMIDARQKAIEQNETLKTQQEELKRAQDLWTAPLKSALESIQSTAADAFEGMLESGRISFDSLKDIFTRTLRRMAAEFLALATIRPVMSVLVNAVSPGFAQQIGLGSTSGSATGGGLLSGGGLGNLFGGGSLGNWLSSPISFGSALNTSAASPASFAAPAGATGASLGGLTWGGALGGLAGLGMGAYSLATGNPIGGAASILGGGLALLGPALGLGAAAGPIGIGIGLLGSLLPSLFGQTKPTITNQEYGQVSYGGGGFRTSGGAWGPNANAGNLQGPLAQIGQTMESIFKAFGGVKEAGKVWGVALESFSQQYGDGNSFSNQTSFLVGPGGEKRQWGMGSNASDIGMEPAGVAATLNSILGGAVGDISENMRKALGTVNQSGKDTFATLSTVVTEVMAFDEAIKGLGKTTTEAEQGLKNIDAQFASIYATAEKYGLDSSAVTLAKDAARGAFGTTFAESIERELDTFTDPKKWQLIDLDRWLDEAKKNNAELVKELPVAYHDQILKIEELYSKKRVAIIESAGQASVTALAVLTANINSIQGLIRELSPGGALSNLDPAGQLAGLRASSNASLAQAFADPTNAALIDRAVADQRAFLEFNRSFTGGSTAYVRDQQAALGQLQALQGATTQSAMSVSDPVVRNLLQQLLTAVQAANKNSAERDSDIDEAMGLLRRYLANAA